MSDLTRRPKSHTPRRVREQRAYALILATSGLSVLAVVGVVLAVIGVLGYGTPLLAVVAAVACGLVLRRTVGR